MSEKEISIDDLPSVQVSPPDLHEQTLEQVILTPVQLSADDRYPVRIYDVLGYNNTKDLVSYIANINDLSFTSTVATILVHGWAIMAHEHKDVFSSLKHSRNESLQQNYRMYHQVKSGITISPQFCNPKFMAFTDEAMHDDVSIKSDLLRMSNSKFCTICLCMSLQDSDYVIPEFQLKFKETVEFFNYNCNILLSVLQGIKY